MVGLLFLLRENALRCDICELFSKLIYVYLGLLIKAIFVCFTFETNRFIK